MIEINGVNKKFSNTDALNNVIAAVQEKSIFGLVGTNGAGKSTLLRIMCGVICPDTGSVMVDGENVYENPKVKGRICFLSDEAYFFPNATGESMAEYYEILYPHFDEYRFFDLMERFQLDRRRKLASFSKGMKRQVLMLLGICAGTKYLLCDETFDGLDPVMRNLVKNLITQDVLEHQATAIITSHSLRELEDTCDQLALLHKGGLVLESDIQNLKTSLFKIQIAFSGDFGRDSFDGIDILHFSKRGSVASMIVRGGREETVSRLQAMMPILLDVLPLSLEEVFTYEMEALGYAFQDVLDA